MPTVPPAPVVAVVGGGISGLVAAWRLQQGGAHVVLLEQSGRFGGVLRRGEVGGVVLDLGAESVLARRPEAVDLALELGLADDLVHPATARATVWSRGALHPLPAGTVMGVPSGPDALAGLLTPDEVERVRAEPAAAPEVEDVSVGDFVAGRLGSAVVERLVDPLLGGVYAGRAERLSLRATVPALWPAARDGHPLLVPRAATAGVATGGPVFAGLRGGVGRLAEVLVERLVAEGVEVRTDACVQEVVPSGAGWRVVLGPAGRGPALEVDAVLLAVPAPATARLLRPLLPAAAQRLADVRMASLALVTAVLEPGALDGVADGLSGVLVPAVEGRLVKAMTFSSRKWEWVHEAAGGAEVLRLSVGRAGQERSLQRSDDDLVSAALADASELLGVPLVPRAAQVTRWGGGLPQFDVGHLDLVADVGAQVAGVRRLETAGAVWSGVGVPACVATAGAAAARLLDDLG